jgi:HPt (histidine-containing phosphotransfer) domain-containing protein
MLEREEYEEAERLAHTVKGGAGNLEAKNVFEASHRIEEALKEGRHEEVQDLIPALDAATKAAVEAVATLKR